MSPDTTSRASVSLRWLYLCIALAALAVEVVNALRFRDWPFVRGSLGDVLVIVLLYFLLRAATRLGPVSAAVAAVGSGFLAEALQLIGLVDRLGIPKNSLLGVVFGSRFSVSDLLMYILGGVVAFTIDRYLLARQPNSSQQRP